jgi:hypothetical protein
MIKTWVFDEARQWYLHLRGGLARNAYVFVTRWNRFSTVSGPVLRRTPGGPHLPPRSLPLPVEERKGERAARERKHIGNLSHNGCRCKVQAL